MSLEMFSLKGRTAIVTGANTGLGQGIAVGLASAGANIIAVGTSQPTETEKKVAEHCGSFAYLPADLRSTEPLSAVMAEAIDQFGRIDILVNNAGMIRREDSVNFSEADWDDVMNVNIKSAFFLCQLAGRHMIKMGGGKIINVASMLSFQGGIRVPSYTASKSALAGITKLLANEWASKNVNVNAIAPGYMATDNTAALRDDPTRATEIMSRIPAGRWGHPSDLAGAAIFLASAASDYMHGTIVPVDGGWLAR